MHYALFRYYSKIIQERGDRVNPKKIPAGWQAIDFALGSVHVLAIVMALQFVKNVQAS